MDDSLRDGSGQKAPVEPTDLPDGWHYADVEAWSDPYRAGRRRKRVIIAAVVVAIVAGMTGLAVWDAAAHYTRGVYALRIHEYSLAADELSAANVFGISYRNARSLEGQVRRDEAADSARHRQAEAAQAAMVAQLDRVGAGLKAGANALLAALHEVDPTQLQAALVDDRTIRRSVAALAADIAAAARRALRSGTWSRAERFTTALLLLEPSSKLATSLAAQAKRGRELSVKLSSAESAARHHKWRQALRLARAVVGAQKDFPGAAALVAEARTALAPKPRTRVATTASRPATSPPASAPASQPAPP